MKRVATKVEILQRAGEQKLMLDALCRALERANRRIAGLELVYGGAAELNRQYRANIAQANEQIKQLTDGLEYWRAMAAKPWWEGWFKADARARKKAGLRTGP